MYIKKLIYKPVETKNLHAAFLFYIFVLSHRIVYTVFYHLLVTLNLQMEKYRT